MLVRSPARLSRATACSCARRTRVRTGQRTRATATFPSGAALRVSRAACIMQRRARGCAALHCAPRLASVLLAIRSAVSCCHARECKGAPREAVARAKAFRKTPSRCGSRALISTQLHDSCFRVHTFAHAFARTPRCMHACGRMPTPAACIMHRRAHADAQRFIVRLASRAACMRFGPLCCVMLPCSRVECKGAPQEAGKVALPHLEHFTVE